MTIPRIACTIASLYLAAAPAWAQLAAPKLDTPANGVSKWLFSDYVMTWYPVTDALDYQIVVSASPSFADFDEATGACKPSAPGCVSVRKNSTVRVATPGEFAGFWFQGTATYQWKVRALHGTTRGLWSEVRTFTTTSRVPKS